MAEGGHVLPMDYWREIANDEVKKGGKRLSSRPDSQGNSSDTVLCLDISKSMEGKAFENMIRTAKAFIFGIMSVAQTLKQEENISIVTFGHETRIVRDLCKDYGSLIDVLDTLYADGPSPMEGGLLLSLASLFAKRFHNLQGYYIRPRIIVMTDGLATPGVIISGKDNQYIEKEKRIKIEIQAASQSISDGNYLIYCVPFGCADPTYLTIMTDKTNGKIIPPNEIQRLVYMNSNCILVANLKSNYYIPGEDWTPEIKRCLGDKFSEQDFDFIVSIAEKASSEKTTSASYKEFNSDLPPIGKRVRRGPEWSFGEQDGYGVGTIIGHEKNAWLFVKWDNEEENNYPYNDESGYGVVVVDEIRQLSPGKSIDVGIFVVRGPNWRSGNDDGGPGNTGVCFRIENDNVWVRWDAGTIGRYRFGKEGSYDVEVSGLSCLQSSTEKATDQSTTYKNKFVPSDLKGTSDVEHDAQAMQEFESENMPTSYQQGHVEKNRPETTENISNIMRLVEETSIKTTDESNEDTLPKTGNVADETSEKYQEGENNSNENRLHIWIYKQNEDWKPFEVTVSDTLEEAYVKGRKTKIIKLENVSFRVTFCKKPMVMRNVRTSEVYFVERRQIEINIPQEVLTMEKEWIDLYKNSLLKGKEKVYNIRVMVVGPEGVGKTVLTRRLLKRYVDIHMRQSTNGIDVHIKKCGTRISDGKWLFERDDLEKAKRLENRIVNVMQQIPSQPIRHEDENENMMSASSEVPREIPANNNAPEIDPPIELYSISQDNSSESTEYNSLSIGTVLSKDNDESHPSSPDLTTPKNIETENRDDILQLVKATFEECKETGEEAIGEISFWDFGGQVVFYSTHQTFLTPRAVYIVVIDISRDLKDTVHRPCFADTKGEEKWKFGDYLLFWLKSIKTYGTGEKGRIIPPIIIVATHLDKLREELAKSVVESEVQEALDKAIESFRKELYKVLQDQSLLPLIKSFFAIDNTTEDKSLEKLRIDIYELSSKQQHWGEEKPASWILLEKLLMDQKHQNMKIISFDGLKQLNSQMEYPLSSDRELQMFLTFHHAVGNVVYFKEKCLGENVILDPQWLIDAFKYIITNKEFIQMEDKEMLEHWKAFERYGTLHTSLIDILWTQHKENFFHEHKEHLIRIMLKLDIIAKPLANEDSGQFTDRFLVPPMLKEILTRAELSKITQGSCSTPYFCHVFDDNFLPPAVFHRLLAACMGQWQVANRQDKLLLYCGSGIFNLTKNQSHRLLLCFSEKLIQMKIYCYDTSQSIPLAKFCVDVRHFVENKLKVILSRLDQHISSKPFIRCKFSSYDTTEGLLEVDSLMENEVMVCHQHTSIPSHSVRSCDLLQCWYGDKLYEIPHDSQKSANATVTENYRFEGYATCPSEAELNIMAIKLGPKFRELGRALEIPSVYIDTIEANSRGDVSDHCFEILRKWTQLKGEGATFEYLERKMKEIGIDSTVITEAVDRQ